MRNAEALKINQLLAWIPVEVFEVQKYPIAEIYEGKLDRYRAGKYMKRYFINQIKSNKIKEKRNLF